MATECGIPDTDNAEIQSPSLARDSSIPKQPNPWSDLMGEVFSVTSAHLESIVFKGFYFFLTFSLDRNNIGCPPGLTVKSLKP